MNFDIFKNDAFGLVPLTKALNDVPFIPSRLGDMGVFQSEPITTVGVHIERQGEVLALVPAAARGTPGQTVVPGRRDLRTLNSVHLPTQFTVIADEVQGLRAFGKEDDVETALNWLGRKAQLARRRLELTQEFHRIGALQGIVLDADGTSPLVNLFTEFGVSQQTLSFALSVDTTKMLLKCLTYKRMLEDALGGLPYSDITMECEASFFDAFVQHLSVKDAFAYYNEIHNRSDTRGGFRFGDITWREYRGKVGGNSFIPVGTAFPVISGTPDLYLSNWAPAPYNDTVNTMGMPFYGLMEEMPMKRGWTMELQSNPLIFTTRPGAQVKATI